MDYLPAFHNVRGKLCLEVGGGEVATRKAGVLNEAGATVRVVAPETPSAVGSASPKSQAKRRSTSRPSMP